MDTGKQREILKNYASEFNEFKDWARRKPYLKPKFEALLADCEECYLTMLEFNDFEGITKLTTYFKPIMTVYDLDPDAPAAAFSTLTNTPKTVLVMFQKEEELNKTIRSMVEGPLLKELKNILRDNTSRNTYQLAEQVLLPVLVEKVQAVFSAPLLTQVFNLQEFLTREIEDEFQAAFMAEILDHKWKREQVRNGPTIEDIISGNPLRDFEHGSQQYKWIYQDLEKNKDKIINKVIASVQKILKDKEKEINLALKKFLIELQERALENVTAFIQMKTPENYRKALQANEIVENEEYKDNLELKRKLAEINLSREYNRIRNELIELQNLVSDQDIRDSLARMIAKVDQIETEALRKLALATSDSAQKASIEAQMQSVKDLRCRVALAAFKLVSDKTKENDIEHKQQTLGKDYKPEDYLTDQFYQDSSQFYYSLQSERKHETMSLLGNAIFKAARVVVAPTPQTVKDYEAARNAVPTDSSYIARTWAKRALLFGTAVSASLLVIGLLCTPLGWAAAGAVLATKLALIATGCATGVGLTGLVAEWKLSIKSAIQRGYNSLSLFSKRAGATVEEAERKSHQPSQKVK